MRSAIPGTALDVDRLVESDPVDPGAELRVTSKRGQTRVHSHEDLLRHIFRLGREAGTEDGDRQAEDRIAITADQFRERVLVSALSEGLNKSVVGIHTGLFSESGHW